MCVHVRSATTESRGVKILKKSKLDEGWINGGFFVMEPAFLKFIDKDGTYIKCRRERFLRPFLRGEEIQIFSLLIDKI